MLKFPKLGSVVRCPVAFERRGEDFDFEVGIKLLGATQSRAWMFQHERNMQAERRRVTAMKVDDPGFEGPITEDGAKEGSALSREILTACLVDVSGIDFDGATTPAEIIDGLEAFGLIDIVAGVALTAQSPRPEQLLSSGS